ncbi:MAG: hypothetical protein V1859_02865 [archaeon]
MNDIIKKDILRLLTDSIAAIERDEILKLRDISNEVIHNASIFQDEDSISTAIMVYTISKLYRDEDIRRLVLPDLWKLVENLNKNEFELFRQGLKELMNKIPSKKKNTKLYVPEIFEQAQVSKGTKIYDHGISIARVAETIGASVWGLTQYIGKTTIPDSFKEGTDVKNKLKYTRSLFVK